MNVLGTTCATVLTRAIFTEGCKSVAAGMNAMDLRRGITMAVDAVVTNLKSRARMISTSEEIAQVLLFADIVLISVHNEYFGKLSLAVKSAISDEKVEELNSVMFVHSFARLTVWLHLL